MYRLQNGVVSQVPASGVAPDGRSISGFLPEYIAAMPACERQALGFFHTVVEDSNFTIPTEDRAADCIRVPFTPSEVEDPRIAALRAAYREKARQFCHISGGEIKYKLESYEVESAINADPDNLRLTQLALALFSLITDLRRVDGDDAWDRI